MKSKKSTSPFLVPPGTKISLKKDYDPGYTDDYTDKKDAAEKLQADIEQLATYQDMLYAQDTYALLLIFQAMDAAGKDGTIKHVMSGVNPQGATCAASSTRLPRNSTTISCGDAAKRCRSADGSASSTVPITRRSSSSGSIPRSWKRSDCRRPCRGKGFWKRRFEAINNFEKHITNGIVVLKFFLNVSKAEQRKRFLAEDRPPGEELEVLGQRRQGAGLLGRLPGMLRGRVNHTSTTAGPGTSFPPTTNGLRAGRGGHHCRHAEEAQARYPTVSESASKSCSRPGRFWKANRAGYSP